MQCKLCLLYGVPYNFQNLHKTVKKTHWVGNVLVSNCVQVMYKNFKYKVEKLF